MSSPSPFARLLDQSPPAQRERLVQLRDELALTDNDALWSLLEVVEAYCASLLARRGMGTPSQERAPWRLLTLAAGTQVLLLAGAMYVGGRVAAGGAAIAWASCQSASEPSALVATILGAPAGWLALGCALPALAHGVRVGWRSRAEEPLVGWIIASTSALAALGLVGLLLWLL